MLSTAGARADYRWDTYVNNRLGTTVDYPSDIFREEEQLIEDDGALQFQTESGDAAMFVLAAPNTWLDPPKAYLEKYINLAGVQIRQLLITDIHYVVEGTRNGQVLYERCIFPQDPPKRIHCVGVIYPAAHSAKWEPIVARIARSLRYAPRP